MCIAAKCAWSSRWACVESRCEAQWPLRASDSKEFWVTEGCHGADSCPLTQCNPWGELCRTTGQKGREDTGCGGPGPEKVNSVFQGVASGSLWLIILIWRWQEGQRAWNPLKQDSWPCMKEQCWTWVGNWGRQLAVRTGDPGRAPGCSMHAGNRTDPGQDFISLRVRWLAWARLLGNIREGLKAGTGDRVHSTSTTVAAGPPAKRELPV